MTSYTPNIPQPGDNPSVSQDQLLQNFQTLNTIYGSSGDHYPWNDTNSIEIGKHAKVTLPGLPTSSLPGNVLPVTAVGNCAIFAQSQAPNVGPTYPYLLRDGASSAVATNIYTLMPIKAYAAIASTNFTTVSLLDSFNILSITSTGANPTQVITINFANAMASATNFGVLITCTKQNYTASYSIVDESQIKVTVTGIATANYNLTVIVLES